MRRVLTGVFLLVALAITPAYADDSAGGGGVDGNELLFGTNTGTLAFSNSIFTAALSVGYLRGVAPSIQVGLTGNMGITTTAQAFQVLAWGYYNFDSNMADSMFLGVGAGLNNVGGGATSNFKLAGEIGKRMEIASGLMYRPALEVNWVSGGFATFIGKVINFSYLW